MAVLGNNFWDGDLKVCQLYFDAVDLGKTTGGCILGKNENYKEIMKDQNGTAAYDKIRTSFQPTVKATFSDLTISLYTKLISSLEQAGNSVNVTRKIFRSQKDEAKTLDIYICDDTGAPVTTDPKYRLHLYLASPEITSDLSTSGPDNQRTVEVTFNIWFDEDKQSYGYSGNASSLGL